MHCLLTLVTPSIVFLATEEFRQTQVVFDIAESGYRTWWIPVAGAVVVLFLWMVRRAGLGASSPAWRSPTKFGFWFMLLWTGLALTGTLGEYVWLRWVRSQELYQVVEGRVAHFEPADEQHHEESFWINGNRFVYSDSRMTSAFNRTARRDGPIRENQRVRIFFYGSKILRLEVLPDAFEEGN